MMNRRSRVFRKYAVVFVALVSGALLVSDLTQAYFGVRENETALTLVQQEKAASASAEIRRFLKDIDQQMAWANPPMHAEGDLGLEQRRGDYLRLLRQAPAFTDVSYLDAGGREQVRVSRLAMNVVGGGLDRSGDAAFIQAKLRGSYYGPVYFRNESEPYMTAATAESGPEAGVSIAEVNLKLIWDVVAAIRLGQAGYAYIVDPAGQLVAHKDISLVLRKTDLSSLSHVSNAIQTSLATARPPREPTGAVSHDQQGGQVLTTYEAISPPGWLVFVEQPLSEAYAPLYGALVRTAAFLVAGFLLSLLVSLVLARRMVTPIQALQTGAARLGAGALDERIDVHTGDELEALAEEFNRMAGRLQESYTGLERTVEERTRDLAHALEEQTATAQILKSVSQSGFQLQPVLETMVRNAMRLCSADEGFMFRLQDDGYHLAIACEVPPELETLLAGSPLPPGRDTLVGRVALEGRPIHIEDVLGDPEYAAPEVQRLASYRTILGVPVLREGVAIGVIGLGRQTVRPFTDREIQLVTTFADEALIAIESVRLFEEIEEKSRQLAVASQHKSQFLANMSHELRTPLNAVIGFSDVLLARMFGELNEKQEEYLSDILTSGQHLLGLLNDILDISKVEAGRMELEIGIFSVPEALQSGLTLVKERAASQGIKLGLDLDPRVGLIQADERKVKQIVFNLLSNAVKFTPSGGRVDVSAQIADGELYIAVRDTGIGIAPEDQERVFEEFQQAWGPTNRNEGTGLGLALARRFVELHGGRLWLESQLGVGSIFTFSLPLRQGQAAPAEPVAQGGARVGPERANGVHAGQTILVIEDDPCSADLMWLYLTGAGFDAVVAHDAEEALEIAREVRPAAITLDVLLPGMDGWEFLSQAKSDPALADIPVIIVSMLDERGRGYALGAADYVLKPVNREDLLAALGRLTDRAEPHESSAAVLAIDDDPMAVSLIQAALEPRGYRVKTATSGEEGLDIARSQRPGLVILDLLMPGMDGFTVVEQLRSDPATEDIPVIILTAKALTKEERERLTGRISELARKSEFDLDGFVSLVRRHCRTPVA